MYLCVSVCVCVLVSLKNQINQSVADVHGEAVVSQSDSLLLQVDAEHRFTGNGQLPLFFLSQDGHLARPQHGVLIPHQLHSGQVWCKRRRHGVRRSRGGGGEGENVGRETQWMDVHNRHQAQREGV